MPFFVLGSPDSTFGLCSCLARLLEHRCNTYNLLLENIGLLAGYRLSCKLAYQS